MITDFSGMTNDDLILAIEIAMASRPSMKMVMRDGKRFETEVYEYNAPVAINALEELVKCLKTLGKHHEANFVANEEELRARFQGHLQELRALEGDDFVDALIEGRSINS